MTSAEAPPARSRLGLGLALAVFLLRTLPFLDRGLVVDDAFISFRYARNLARGLGLVFNPGEAVEGYTNLLWTLTLGLTTALGLDPIVVSWVASIGAGCATIALLSRWSAALFPQSAWTAALPALLFACMPSQARLATSGLETLVFTGLVTLGYYLHAHGGRSLAAGAALALAVLTRPEGLLFAAVLIAYAAALEPAAAASRSWRAWRIGAPVAITQLAIFAWRSAYYGAGLWPNTYYAKVGLPAAELARKGLSVLGDLALDWGLWLLVALAAFGLRSVRRDAFWWLPTLAVAATAASFVRVGGDFLPFFGARFLVPALPLLLLLVARGFENIRARWAAPSARLAWSAVLTAALVVQAAWFSWPARFTRLPGLRAQMQAWREVGEWLAREAAAGSSLAVGAAGVIPYVSGLPTIDMYGLTDRHIAHGPPAANWTNRAIGHSKSDPEYVLGRQPNYIFSRVDAAGAATEAGLRLVRDEVAAHYRMVAMVKDRSGWPPDGVFIVPVSAFSAERWRAGYRSAVLERLGSTDPGRPPSP